jgi:hypothetical protein
MFRGRSGQLTILTANTPINPSARARIQIKPLPHLYWGSPLSPASDSFWAASRQIRTLPNRPPHCHLERATSFFCSCEVEGPLQRQRPCAVFPAAVYIDGRLRNRKNSRGKFCPPAERWLVCVELRAATCSGTGHLWLVARLAAAATGVVPVSTVASSVCAAPSGRSSIMREFPTRLGLHFSHNHLAR